MDGGNLVSAIFQNAGRGCNTGIQAIFNQKMSSHYSFNLKSVIYGNQIDAFMLENLYSIPHSFSADKQEIVSGHIKWNNILGLSNNFDVQLILIYLASDIIPQGKVYSRFLIALGLKKSSKKEKINCF